VIQLHAKLEPANSNCFDRLNICLADRLQVLPALVEEVLLCAPGAIGDAKALVNDFVGQKIDRGLIDETARRIARRRVSDEGQEGVRAFLERRKPGWTI